MFVDSWGILYKILSLFLTEIQLQSTSKLFMAATVRLGVMQLNSTARLRITLRPMDMSIASTERFWSASHTTLQSVWPTGNST